MKRKNFEITVISDIYFYAMWGKLFQFAVKTEVAEVSMHAERFAWSRC